MDIKESKEVIQSLLKLAETLEAVMADGKVSITDIPKIVPLFVSLKSALEGAKLVPSELKDLTEDETKELMDLSVQAVLKLATVIMGLVGLK
jgi:hypothetical protein